MGISIHEKVSLLLGEHFNIDEVKTLCFSLEIDYENLPGETKNSKIRELILYVRRIDRFQDLLLKAKQERPNVTWPIGAPNDVLCPYPGLDPFTEDNSEHFWGRDKYIKQLINLTKKYSIVSVIGQSGCGKTSLISAGLLPYLNKDEANIVVKFDPGSEPFVNLYRSLVKTIPNSSLISEAAEIEQYKDQLRTGNIDLGIIFDRIFESNPKSKQLFIIINQFEEIFTRCKNEKIRNQFLDKLISLENSQPLPFKITVVLTLRDDFLNSVMKHIPFVDKFQDGILLLPLLDSLQLQKAIVEPATKLGVKLENGLLERILEDAGEEAGRLPLVQFSLQRLWDGQANGQMTHDTYNSFGGVKSVINETADDIFLNFTSEEKTIAYSIFMRLIEIDRRGRVSKRKLDLNDVKREREDQNFQIVLDQLAKIRLLTVQDESVHISHEAIFEQWETLRNWLNENRRIISIHYSVQQKAKSWSRDKNNEYWLRGDSFNEVEVLLEHFRNQNFSASRNDRKGFIDKLTILKFVYDKVALEAIMSNPEANFINAFNSAEIEFAHSVLKANLRDDIQIWGRRFLLIFIVVIFLPFIFGFLRIKLHDGVWEPISEIWGGRVQAIESSGNTIIIAVASENKYTMFRSTDNGNNWNAIENLPRVEITDILILPRDNEKTLFVGTHQSGIFRSRNNGVSWELVNEGLLNYSITKLLVNDDRDQTLFASTTGRNGGVYKSANMGDTWERVSNGLVSTNVSSLAIDPVDGWIFAATNAGLFRSRDGGENWFPTQLSEISISDVVVDFFNHNVVFAAGNNGRFYKSSDAGANWMDMSVGIPFSSDITTFSLSKVFPDTIYAAVQTFGGSRIFRSVDGAENWTQVSNSAAGLPVNIFHEHDTDGNYLVGTDNGLFKTDLSNDAWARLDVGLPGVNIHDIERRENGETFLTISGGVFRSNNQIDWEFYNSGLIHSDSRFMYPDPINEDVLYMGFYSIGAQDNLFVSNDRGRSWTSLGSVNNGLSNDDVRDMVINPVDPAEMYVVTYGGGVFKTTNRGNEWISKNAGINNPVLRKIVMDPKDSQILFVLPVGGPIYKTVDGGEFWEPLSGTADLDIRDFVINANDLSLCIAVYGVQEGSIRCNSDQDLNWENMNSGINSTSVTHLEISSEDFQLMYAGTMDDGIFWSRNSGRNWEPINSGLPTGILTHLIVNPTDDSLFAIIENNGVFELYPKLVFRIERN